MDTKRGFLLLASAVQRKLEESVAASPRLIVELLKHLTNLKKLSQQAHVKPLLAAISLAVSFIKVNGIADIAAEESTLAHLERKEKDFALGKSQQSSSTSSGGGGGFEWFYSEIIGAAKRGDWLVLDNVNRANQAVLARLHPLLEQSFIDGKRKMVVTECASSTSADSIEVIEIHEDFRLFLLADDSQGETMNESMKNKCVQVKVDTFHAETAAADFASLASLHLHSSGDASTHAYIVSLAMKFMSRIGELRGKSQCFTDFATFVDFLRLINGSLSRGLLEGDGGKEDLLALIQRSFIKAFSPKAVKYAIDIHEEILAVTPLPTSIEANRAAMNLQEEFPAIVKEKYEEFSLLYESRLAAASTDIKQS